MAVEVNPYIALDLDTSVGDWSAIDARISAKQSEWSRAVGGAGKRRQEAGIFLEQLDSIRRVMQDPTQRMMAATEANIIRETVSREARINLSASIEVIAASGSICSKAQFRDLEKAAEGTLSDQEIRDLLAQAGVEIEGTDGSSGSNDLEEISEADKARLAELLQTTDHSDLYEFLASFVDASGLGKQSSAASLRQLADEYNKELLRTPQSEAVQAGKELCGLALTLFASQDAKLRYDTTLGLEKMEALRPQIDVVGRGNFINSEAFEVLIRQALNHGADVETARSFILSLAARKKWRVQQSKELQSSTLLKCGFCGRLSEDASAQRCTGGCGELLRSPCPGCDTAVPTQDRACGNCGWTTGDEPVVRRLLARGNKSLEGGFVEEAIQAFESALRCWPQWEPAKEALRSAEQRGRQRKEEWQELEALVAASRVAEARRALGPFTERHGASEQTEQLAADITSRIRRAEELVREFLEVWRQGQRAQGYELLDAARSYAKDHPDVVERAASIPPPAPTSFQTRTVEGGFRFEWGTSEEEGPISHRLVRRTGAPPGQPDDGVCVQTVRGAMAEDLEAPVGEGLYYSVFAERFDVFSQAAARCGPLLRTAPVAHLRVTAGDGEVKLQWVAPPGCLRVDVARSRGDASEEGLGKGGDWCKVESSLEQAHDAGLVPSETYAYRLTPAFEDPRKGGGEVAGEVSVRRVSPVASPLPVLDLAARIVDGEVELQWTPPEEASLAIYESLKPVDLAEGTKIAASELRSLGARIDGASELTAGRATARLRGSGRITYLPMSIRGDLAIAGRPVSVSNVPSVTGLNVQAEAGRAVLRWDWPQQVDEVLVCVSEKPVLVGPDELVGERYRVTRTDYEQSGHWVLQKELAHLSIYSVGPGEGAYSEPLAASYGPEHKVHYRIVKKKDLLRRVVAATLELRSSEITGLRRLVLGVGEDRVPISLDAAAATEPIPEVRFEQGIARIPLPTSLLGRRRFGRLFFEVVEEARGVRLMPAEKDELRLG